MVHRVIHSAATTLMGYHKALMPFAWSVLIDIAIFLPFYVQLKYSLIAHIILAGVASGISILSASKSLAKGLPPSTNAIFFHKLLGLIIFILIAFQASLGLVSKLSKSSDTTKSKTVLFFRKAHTYLGYAIALVSKFQVLRMFEPNTIMFWFNLVWNVVAISLYIYRQVTHAKLQSDPNRHVSYGLRNIQPYGKSLLIYGNYIYSGQTIEQTHPAGREVIRAIKGRCIERFLYGMLPPDHIPSFPLHSHSIQSIQLLGSPISKLDIKQPYLHLQRDLQSAVIHRMETISQEGQLYIIYIGVNTAVPIKFAGYSHLNQLGRYYSLTCEGITRLYSIVNFLNLDNIQFLKSRFGNVQVSKAPINQLTYHEKGLPEEILQQQEIKSLTLIPLLIKVYQNGRFTPQFLKRQQKNIILSNAQGRGLELDKYSEGTMIMIGGGTGFNPYCDLIDLLYKAYLMEKQPMIARQILEKNPILMNQPFAKFRFLFFIAVNSLSQIHLVTQKQLLVLCEAGKIEVKMRIKQKVDLPRPIVKVTENFQNILAEMLRKNEKIGNIYICGPPRMNNQITQCLDNMHFSKYTLL